MILGESVKYKFVLLFTNQSYHATLIAGYYATDIKVWGDSSWYVYIRYKHIYTLYNTFKRKDSK